MNETREAIANVFIEAGWSANWKTDDPTILTYSQNCGGSWNVGGIAPDGVMRWKNTGIAPDGPETPDDPVEAARVLVASVVSPPVTKLGIDWPPHIPEEAYVQAEQYRQRAEGEAAGDPAEAEPDSIGFGNDAVAEGDDGSAAPGDAGGGGALQPYAGQDGPGDSDREYAFDADYEEVGEELGAELLDSGELDLPALTDEAAILEGADPWGATPPTEHAQDRFIGLDDLDRRRSLRIGDVIRYGNSLMPKWNASDDARLSTLRNFTMGVSEGRWPDNPTQRVELDTLEATLGRINEIKNARDAKVEFLESATREQIESFIVEADWP